MATTGSNFVEITATTLSGTAVSTAPYLDAMGPKEALTSSQPTQGIGTAAAATPAGSCVDRIVVDPSLTTVPAVGTPYAVPANYGTILGAFSKNGCQLMKLSSSTPENLDLTDLTANSPQSYAGDTTFSNVNCIIVNNIGTQDLTLSPGSSNPARLPAFGGTTPTLTIPKGSVHVFHSAANLAVDSSHKIITITPSAGGTVAITVCGS